LSSGRTSARDRGCIRTWRRPAPGPHARLYDRVAEINVCAISPERSKTYSDVLRQLTTALSPTAVFQSAAHITPERNRVTVTDDWCIYRARRPVEARDRDALVDQLLKQGVAPPPVCWALPNSCVDHGRSRSLCVQACLPESILDSYKWRKRT